MPFPWQGCDQWQKRDSPSYLAKVERSIWFGVMLYSGTNEQGNLQLRFSSTLIPGHTGWFV